MGSAGYVSFPLCTCSCAFLGGGDWRVVLATCMSLPVSACVPVPPLLVAVAMQFRIKGSNGGDGGSSSVGLGGYFGGWGMLSRMGESGGSLPPAALVLPNPSRGQNHQY